MNTIPFHNILFFVKHTLTKRWCSKCIIILRSIALQIRPPQQQRQLAKPLLVTTYGDIKFEDNISF